MTVLDRMSEIDFRNESEMKTHTTQTKQYIIVYWNYLATPQNTGELLDKAVIKQRIIKGG